MKTINNNIQESYCSFEVSKLLKEKGFDIPCYSFFKEDDLRHGSFFKNNRVLIKNSELDNKEYSEPTHALAIEWIRINFGMWIHIKRFAKDKPNKFKYFYEIQQGNGFDMDPVFSGDFNSPQEATEAALLYVLNNLI